MRYFFDIIGWVESNPDFYVRRAIPYLIKIKDKSELNDNILELSSNYLDDKYINDYKEAAPRLLDFLLESEHCIFAYAREWLPNIYRIGENIGDVTAVLSVNFSALAYDFTKQNLADWLIHTGCYDNTFPRILLIRDIYPHNTGIRITYYMVYQSVVRLNNAIRVSLIDDFLEETV